MNFFECPTSEFLLYFIHGQLVTFHTAVSQIEDQNVSAIEAAKLIYDLQKNLDKKQVLHFSYILSVEYFQTCKKKGQNQEDCCKINITVPILWGTYQDCVISISSYFYKTTSEYLQQQTSYNQSELQERVPFQHCPEVFDEFTLISLYISEKLQEWSSDSPCKPLHYWIQVFQQF